MYQKPLMLGMERSGQTYVMCKARYHRYPDFVCSHRQVWIGCDQKVVKQPQIRHGLFTSEAVETMHYIQTTHEGSGCCA